VQLIAANTTFSASNEFPEFGDYQSAYGKPWKLS
jgi:hypothetical protein